MLSDNYNQKISTRDILDPLVFFDLFDFPLTAYEIWHYLDCRGSLAALTSSLEMIDSKILGQKNGFYFLSGRENIVETRKIRYNYSCHKIKIAKRFARAFAFSPFVKTIAIANFIGDHNLRQEGDIDFFIITSARRIWLSRLFCAGLAKLLNSRPTAKKKQDKICLSFYISEEHLDIRDLALGDNDPYFYYWLRGLLPIYDSNNFYQQFLAANNLSTDKFTAVSIQISWLDALEKIAKKWQLKIMSPGLKKAMNNSDGVVISDSVLKLYLSDRRRLFAEKFKSKYDELLKKIN
ncbi:MAG: hypothetical protein HY931_04030 [Candidatus Falkowbacteria bacterium]|nr:MAG: hypothetical protein HY931_04030 [Candidatus Falkowbacteria bacterium]